MKLFGTDGIRGRANQYPITAEVALDLGKALVTFVKGSANKKIKIAVGRDTRISGSMLEEAVIAGITASGADALPLGVIPSNAVSYFLQLHGCEGGIMVSASHNPADENGFKVFNGRGFKLSEAEEQKLEEIFFSKRFASAKEPGSVFRIRDVKQSYILMVRDSLRGRDLSGLKIAVDPGNGAASYIIKDMLHELKAEATIINNEPDGRNINSNCGALFPEQLQKLVAENKLDAGIAFDGDADRLVIVDENGDVVDGDAIIAIAALDLKGKGRLSKDTVVVTNYSNFGLDESMKKFGIKTVRVDIGDKHVSEELFRSGCRVGGENSGHVVFAEFAKGADAVLAAAQVLAIAKEQKKNLSELTAVLTKYPQVMINVEVREKKGIEEIPAVAAKMREAEQLLYGKGRVFVRYSGTENKMRILVEGQSESKIKQIAEGIAEAVRQEIGAE